MNALRRFWPIIHIFLLTLAISACSLPHQRSYQETYEIKSLKVVFMNEEGLREKYALLSGHASVQFSGLAASSTVKTVRGFFDFSTNTIYCPKMNFEVCGHELHHAIIGRFHSDN